MGKLLDLTCTDPQAAALLGVKPPIDPVAAEVAKTGAVAQELGLQATPPEQGTTPEREARQTQAQELLQYATASGARLWHDDRRTAYITVPVGGHHETWPVRSRDCRLWLVGQYYGAQGKPPSSEALQGALGVLEAQAVFGGPQEAVYLRVGQYGGNIYLDLGDRDWRAVEITPTGWRVVSDPPVHFRRPPGMLPLPEPVPGGSIDELRPLLPAMDDDGYRLVVAWLVAALRPTGPYPILLAAGEQGSGKTTMARALRRSIDPHVADLRTAPKEERDLAIAGHNAWILGYDNLSGIPVWLSDALCRVSTGEGFSTRTLYEDDQETIFAFWRPAILTGIDDLISRNDLADRVISLTLPRMERRRDERTYWREYEQVQPRILGALLEGVSMALRRLDQTVIEDLPRMADFALWVAAAEPAFGWPEGSILAAYRRNRATLVESSLEADAVASAVRAMLRDRQGEPWEGQAKDLLYELRRYVPETVQTSKSYPKSPRALSGRLRRAATFLREAGVEIEFDAVGHDKKHVIRLATKKVAETHTAHTARAEVACGADSDAVCCAVRPGAGGSDIPQPGGAAVCRRDVRYVDDHNIPRENGLPEPPAVHAVHAAHDIPDYLSDDVPEEVF